MAERLHPGVYVEERRGGLAPIQGVSTSNMGIVGFTTKGPTDVATLVTSYTQFKSTFGDFTGDSQVPTHVFAFYSNGGRRSYVVRVVGAGALESSGTVEYDVTDEVIDTTPNGVLVNFSGTLSELPVVAGSVEVKFNVAPAGTGAVLNPVIGGAAPNMTLTLDDPVFHPNMVGQTLTLLGCTSLPNDGPWPITAVSTDLKTITFTNAAGVAEPLPPPAVWSVAAIAEPSDLSPTPAALAVTFTGKLGTVTDDIPIVPGSVVILGIAAGESYSDTGKDGILYEAAAPAVPTGFVDYETGHFVITFTTAPVNPADVTYAYVQVGLEYTATDDGAGALIGSSVTAGTINYTTGAWTLDVTGYPPHDTDELLADYSYENWPFAAQSAGVWGNGLRVDMDGDENYWDRTTASFTRHRVLVQLRDSATDPYELQETFDNVSLTDPTDARYGPTLIGTTGIGSDLVDMSSTPVNVTYPPQLHGIQQTRAIGGADGTQTEFGSDGATPTIPQPFVCSPLPTPIQPGSVTITWYDALGVARTITDDGDGNLVGQIDPGAAAGFNEIDYDTGEFAFTTGDGLNPEAPADYSVNGANSILRVVWYTTPAVDTESEALSGGTDGAAITRNELTDPALLADREGMYALLVPDEIINLVIPDAAGDVTMSLDMTTECERNEKWFAILATPPGYNPQEAQDYRLNKLGYTGSYAALYYPYITITDPVTDLPLNVPPGGHIAGCYARTDTDYNVATAPAGVDRGRLEFCTGLERNLEWAELDILHPFEVNALLDKTQTGRVIWGARSLERPGGDFRYLQVRRLFNFLKASIFNSTHGFVFENIGASLRQRIKISIESFLGNLFEQGYFKGESRQEAFLVICDESNNPPEVEDTGTVICDIYVAPQKPGEFIVFRLQQKFETS